MSSKLSAKARALQQKKLRLKVAKMTAQRIEATKKKTKSKTSKKTSSTEAVVETPVCEFWLSNNAGSDKLLLPVLPEQLTVTHDSQNESVTVAGLGEITIIQDPTAKTYEWTSHFPAVMHQGVIPEIKKDPTKLLTPQAYVSKIEEWIASKKPIKFSATGTAVNVFCSIESWNYYEKGGDPDTLYYTIKLKEYKEVTVRKLDLTPTVPATPPPATPTQAPTTPTYQNGKVKTNGSRLMLRQKPSTSSKILAKMPNGSSLKIKSKSGSWYAVIYSGKDGYAYAKWVKKL